MTQRTGRCLCGAVKFTAETGDKFAMCFCKMCQQWSAGQFMGVGTEAFEVTEGAEHLTVFKSSDWANRGFCNTCGSNIYFHMPNHGSPSVALGTLDDTSGLENRIRFFIDKKPEGLTLGGAVKSLTEAECLSVFASEDEG